MSKYFIHETRNSFGDRIEAESRDGLVVILTVRDKDGDLQRAILTCRDLTAIIAGLTAIRDAMPEGE